MYFQFTGRCWHGAVETDKGLKLILLTKIMTWFRLRPVWDMLVSSIIAQRGEAKMKLISFITLLLAVSGVAAGAGGGCSEPTVRISAEAMADSDVRAFEKTFRKAVGKVCAWWGPTYTGSFTINIEDSRGPSMALIPGWRGQRGTMLFRTGTTRDGRSAITHEVVHVFAPNANRFLAEGFAVYAHEHLGEQAAYPNFGEDLHEAAKEYADQADFQAMDGMATPRRLRTDELNGKEAYIVAGSFVRFLVENHGLEKFRRLYAMTPMIPRDRNSGDSARWEQVYGKTLDGLATDWRAKITQ